MDKKHFANKLGKNDLANFYPRGNESHRAAHERAAKADRERRELFAV